jgi:GT2 family glycosyltransferase/2-polyprenyl-3-methyl-5-hydroxy-6-metoxy-1,4-benzoquinol methylase
MSRAADLTVVIPTRSRWDTLRRTLSALSAQTVQGFDTLIVADGEDQQVPGDLGASTLVVPWGGPGAARNAGVAAIDTPLVLFLGDDMIPTPHLIEHHLAGHAAHDEVESAVLGHVDWHPDVRRTRLMRWYDWSSSQFDYANIVGEDAGWGRFYSCNVSLKRDFFQATGGFDPDFTFDYEDLDLAYRLHEKGLRLWYERRAVVHHLHEYDWPAMERRYRSRARAEWLMAHKHSWFEPFFGARLRHAAETPPVASRWTWLPEVLPAGRLRDRARIKANRHYLQRLAPGYFDSWAGEEGLDPQMLVHHVQEVEREEEAAADEAEFYRTSHAYLYDLTAFATWPTKLPYRQALQRIMPPGSRLLDYGCGIGADGLRFMDAGYEVAFADFANPSVEYLRWRLARRGREAAIYDIEQQVPGGFDAVYCFDVIEHVDDPFAFLAELESRAKVVAVNFLEPDPNDTHVHHDLPISDLLARVRRRGLLHYRRYHDRSHFVIYGEAPGPQPVRARVGRVTADLRSRTATGRLSRA